MSNEATSLQFSIVIPVYNEAENIEPMVREIQAAFDGRPEAYEVIFVDDASSDDSPAVLQRLTFGPMRPMCWPGAISRPAAPGWG